MNFEIKFIELNNGRHTIVDANNFAHLNRHKWRQMKHGYVVRGVGTKENYRSILMHRLVVGAKRGQVVDHINGDESDNRKSNLRICTHKDNMRNRKPEKNRYKGTKKQTNWSARITVDRKEICLGTFDSEIEAAKAYDSAAKKYYGEFARLNFQEADA